MESAQARSAESEHGTVLSSEKPHPCGLGLPAYFSGEEAIRGLKESPEPLSFRRAVKNLIAFFFHKHKEGTP